MRRQRPAPLPRVCPTCVPHGRRDCTHIPCANLFCNLPIQPCEPLRYLWLERENCVPPSMLNHQSTGPHSLTLAMSESVTRCAGARSCSLHRMASHACSCATVVCTRCYPQLCEPRPACLPRRRCLLRGRPRKGGRQRARPCACAPAQR